jgi:hypothetical protein
VVVRDGEKGDRPVDVHNAGQQGDVEGSPEQSWGHAHGHELDDLLPVGDDYRPDVCPNELRARNVPTTAADALAGTRRTTALRVLPLVRTVRASKSREAAKGAIADAPIVVMIRNSTCVIRNRRFQSVLSATPFP